MVFLSNNVIYVKIVNNKYFNRTNCKVARPLTNWGKGLFGCIWTKINLSSN